jgi:hypothetical protein
MSLVVPLVLVVVALIAQGRARRRYRSGMTGDALLGFFCSMLLMVLAGFYLLGLVAGLCAR